MKIKFEWDERKESENKRKHGVSFAEAATVFTNLPLEVFFDPDNSTNQDRYIAVGFSDKDRLLLVVHCEYANGTIIRLISARKATKKERKSLFGETK